MRSGLAASLMYHIVSIEDEPRFVRVKVSGTWGRESAESLHRDLLRLAEAHGVNRCLVDARELHGHLSVTDAYYAVEGMARAGARLLGRIGVVTSGASNSARFFETASQNRGINLRIFSGCDEALGWVSEDVPVVE